MRALHVRSGCGYERDAVWSTVQMRPKLAMSSHTQGFGFQGTLSQPHWCSQTVAINPTVGAKVGHAQSDRSRLDRGR